MKKWSTEAWAAALPVYEKIARMPFVRELAGGTLPREKFLFYISQDDIYLHHYAQVLSLIAARVSSPEESLEFLEFARGALIAERQMHEVFYTGNAPDAAAKIQPACHHYVSFLKSTAALQPVEVAMAAVLPCFWIYREVGAHIHALSTAARVRSAEVHTAATHAPEAKTNPYQSWIDTYVGEVFDSQVALAIELCDAAAERTTPGIRAAMTDAFVTAASLEFDFWDAADRLRKW